MKRCTFCGREEPDEARFCSVDRQPLESVASPSTEVEAFRAQSDSSFLLQVIFPGTVWLVVYFSLAGLYTILAGYLLQLSAALWAAKDCSKFHPRGSRVLGLAFKPVVVFGIVGLMFSGLGFIWYLVMRRRIKTSPLIFETENESLAA
jgi:hypothetical protein